MLHANDGNHRHKSQQLAYHHHIGVVGLLRSESILDALQGRCSTRSIVSSLTALAEQLLVRMRKFEEYPTAKKNPSASSDTDSFQDLPAELQESRSAAADILQTIRQLTLGPEGIATDILFSVSLSSRKLLMMFPYSQVSRRQASPSYVSFICTKFLKRSR